LRFLFGALILFGSLAAQAARFELRVQELSTVRTGQPIRLGDLTEASSENRDIWNRLYDTVVLEPMNAEETQKIPSDRLAVILRQKLSFQDLQQISVKIPEVFTIQSKRNYFSIADISREIIAQASNLCSDCQFEMDELRLPLVQGSGEILQTRLETQSLRGAGGFLLPLSVTTSQGKNSYWISGRISFFKMAPVAKRLVTLNDKISDEDFEMRRVSLQYSRDGVPTKKDVVGKLAARTLTAGQTIFSSDVKKEPAAKRGQIVKIILGTDDFEIVSSGVAEESGGIGDLIKVRSVDTQRYLSGILTEKGIVRVQ